LEQSGPRREVKGAVANLSELVASETSRRKDKFDGVDARALPAQVAAEMERLVVYADAQERKVSQL